MTLYSSASPVTVTSQDFFVFIVYIYMLICVIVIHSSTHSRLYLISSYAMYREEYFKSKLNLRSQAYCTDTLHRYAALTCWLTPCDNSMRWLVALTHCIDTCADTLHWHLELTLCTDIFHWHVALTTWTDMTLLFNGAFLSSENNSAIFKTHYSSSVAEDVSRWPKMFVHAELKYAHVNVKGEECFTFTFASAPAKFKFFDEKK